MLDVENDLFLLGTILALESFFAVFVLPRLVLWWITRNVDSLMEAIFKAMDENNVWGLLRDKILKGAMGSLGGRPGSLKNMLIQMVASKFLGGMGTGAEKAGETVVVNPLERILGKR